MERDSIYLEVLKMARELVINDYTDRRAEMHNKWLVESEHLWKTQRLRVAYPTIPPYPTDKDIIEVAEKLLEFIPANNIVEEQPKPKEVVEDISMVEEPPIKNALVMLPKEDKEESTIDEKVGPRKVLPSVLERLEKMKNSFL